MTPDTISDAGRDISESGQEDLYNAAYYQSSCGPVPYARSDVWLRFFGKIADEVVRTIHPRRVFDAGCAMGILVESLRDRGVDAWGVDISSYALANVRPDVQPFCRLGSVAEPFGGRFDVVTCIEVLEHITEDGARKAIEQMSASTDVVLFSSTPDDFTEPTHINVRPIVYWLELFGEFDFQPDLLYDASFVAPHAILFRRAQQPLVEDVLLSFSEKLRLKIDLLHAEQEKEDLRKRSLDAENRITELETELQSIRESLGWRTITRYRNWLRAARMRSRAVDRWFEPAAARFLRGFTRAAEPAPAVSPEYAKWMQLHEPSAAELDLQRKTAAELPWRPKFSIILPVYRVSKSVLAAAIESVLHQTYDHWELCIVHADPSDTRNRDYLAGLAASNPQIKLELLPSNLGISGNSDRALLLSEGDFIALLDHDDTLAPFALYEVARLLNENPDLDFIYSDRDEISEDGAMRVAPFFKPGWSPDLLLCANYLTHLCVLRTSVVREIGGWRSETDGAQDWDLFLRAIAKGQRVAHIPKVLYHWRRIATSVAARGAKAKPYAAEAQLKVLRTYLQEQGLTAQPRFHSPGVIQLAWDLKQRPRTTVIILSTETADNDANDVPAPKDADLEIVRISSDESVPLASRMNDAVARTSGEVLVFLDRSVQLDDESWLDEMIGPLSLPGVGVTGCKLFDKRTSSIVHAGICFNADGRLTHPFATDAPHEVFGGSDWYCNWLAVAGACFAISREVFERVGGFSTEPPYPRLDVDLCLRVGLDAGRRVFFNPFARGWKTGPAILEKWLGEDGPAAGAKYIRSVFPDGDPFFNPNLICKAGKVSISLHDH